MEISEIINRNYKATVKRGLITPKTNFYEFTEKLNEERQELNLAHLNSDKLNESEELADVILVCLAMAKHFEIDILKALEEKIIFNENRI
jgi:NTP pyrophosphatase (non-canonical NTP hydrolase)